MSANRPSRADPRRGAAMAFGGKPSLAAKIRKWTPYRNPAGTMAAFLTVEMPSGMGINDLKLMIGPKDKRWIAPPSVKQVDKDGKPRLDVSGKAIWGRVVEFANRATYDRFQAIVLEAVRRDHPEAFD